MRYRLALLAVAMVAAAAVVVLVVRSPAPPSLAGTGSGSLLAESQRAGAPDFAGVDTWINSPPLTLQALRGKVVLVDFWTFSCVNCVRTLPHLESLYHAFRDRGFVLVGVHSPEFDFEKVTANVRSAVQRLGVDWPVAVDSQMGTWNAYGNQYWPAEYLLDQQGRIAYVHDGEGDYQATDDAVAALLGAGSAAVPGATPVPSDTTPELYAGSQRGQLADGETYGQAGQAATYPDRGPPQDRDRIQVTGTWIDQGQYLQAAGPGHVRLAFHAGNVFLVAGTAAGAIQVTVSLDGAGVVPAQSGSALRGSTVAVARQDLVQLVHGAGPGYHVIDLAVPAGFQLYTFTFG